MLQPAAGDAERRAARFTISEYCRGKSPAPDRLLEGGSG
jgi:hypothetical protein